MKCLVTGGAGFIGSNLVDRLIDSGSPVVVLDDLSRGSLDNLKQHEECPCFRFEQGDICDDLSKLFDENNFDAIFHTAALARVPYSFKYPIETNKVNFEGTRNLLLAAKEFGVSYFINSSSSSVYGEQKELPLTEDAIPNPMSPYAMQKLKSEELCKEYSKKGLSVISLRYFNVYGPRMVAEGEYAMLIPNSIGKLLKAERPIIYGNGRKTRDFTFVDDVVEANMKALDAHNYSGQVFNIGSGKSYSVLQVVGQLIRKSGKSEILPLLEDDRKGEPKDVQAGIIKAETLLGWKPEVELTDGLKRTYDWFAEKLQITL